MTPHTAVQIRQGIIDARAEIRQMEQHPDTRRWMGRHPYLPLERIRARAYFRTLSAWHARSHY